MDRLVRDSYHTYTRQIVECCCELGFVLDDDPRALFFFSINLSATVAHAYVKRLVNACFAVADA